MESYHHFGNLTTGPKGNSKMIIGSSLGNKILGWEQQSHKGKEPAFPADTATSRKYSASRQAVQQHIGLNIHLFPSEKRFEALAEISFETKVEKLNSLFLNAKELQIQAVWLGKVEQNSELNHSQSFNWTPVQFVNADSNLSVTWDDVTLELGEIFKLKVKYEVTNPQAGVYFVTKVTGVPEAYECVFTQGQDTDAPHWFPCQDDPRLKVTSQISLKYPNHWNAAANGTSVARLVEGNEVTETWKMSAPHSAYLLAFVAGELQTFQGTWRHKPISALLPIPYGYLGEECISEMKEMLEFYSNYWGFEYPFEQYTQSFVREFPFGGMENTTCTINTDEVLGPVSFSSEEDFRSILVMHEMAHQWFGDTVTCDTWSEGWLNEGFATHSETLWQEHANGSIAGLFYQEFECKQGYLDEAATYLRAVVTNHYEFPSEIFDAHLYQKGSMILHCLRSMLGEKIFKKSVGTYLQRHKFMPVTTTEFRRCLEDVSGRNLEEFFHQYVFSPGHVELNVTYKTDNDGWCIVEAVQSQAADDPTLLKSYETVLLVAYENGSQSTFVCHGKSKIESFRFPAESKILYAFLDPFSTLVGKVSHKLNEAQSLSIFESEKASSWLKYCATQCILKDFQSSLPKSGVFSWIENETVEIVRKEALSLCAQSNSRLAQQFVFDSRVTSVKLYPNWVSNLGLLKHLNAGQVVHKLMEILNEATGEITKVRALLALAKWAQNSPAVRGAPISVQMMALAKRFADSHSFNGLVSAAAIDLMTELVSEMPMFWTSGEKTAAEGSDFLPQSALAQLKQFYLNHGPLVSRRTLGAAKGIAKVSSRFSHLRVETRPLLQSLVHCTEPTRLMTQVAPILASSQDPGLIDSIEEFLERKPYGVMSMVLPRARRSLKKLIKSNAGGELGEKLLALEELKTKFEKFEAELKELKLASELKATILKT
jgi:aminopeptidase N